MLILIILALSVLIFYIAYKIYARRISRIFDENDKNETPAVLLNDGVDYVPTKFGVVFSHHFASIAGAGPIIGPVVALIFGYIPVWLWIMVGTVFFGAVQDYTTLFVSLREKGRSIADVSNKTLGKFGFFLFIAFTIIMLLMVTSAFLGLTTVSLTSLVPLAEMKITGAPSLLKTITDTDGIVKVQIGGIASTSVIIMTFFAPLIGYMLYKKQVKVKIMSLLALLIGIISIVVGVLFPITLNPQIWMYIITVYVVVAAGVPVWLILQPRDFTNSFLLYLGIAALFTGVIGGGIAGVTPQMPAFNIAGGEKILGMIWPFLFITVACGAISGFHALVTGGTVAKQVTSESHAKVIGYGGMILESILAVLVTLTICAGLKYEMYSSIVFPTAPGAMSNPVLAFSLAMGTLLYNALGIPVAVGTVMGILMIEGFVITTLDTAVRLNRYLFEELWATIMRNPPAIFKSYLFNASLSAGLMLLLCYTNTFKLIWPIFGAANQLLAALALIVVSVWLAKRGKSNLFTLIPAIFMMATTLVALWQLLFNQYIPAHKVPLSIAAILLMALSVGVIILSIMKLSSASVQKKSAGVHP